MTPYIVNLEVLVPEKRKGPHLIRKSFWLGTATHDLGALRKAAFCHPGIQEELLMGALHTAPEPFYPISMLGRVRITLLGF